MKRLLAMTMAGCLLAGIAGAAEPDAENQREAARAQRDAIREQLREAREQLAQQARQVAELSRELGENGYFYQYMADENRGMLGVVLSRDDGALKIASVSPGSPAEEAGVEAGDVIVSVNGEAVPEQDDDRRGVIALPDSLRDIEVGQEVRLNVRRDGKNRDMTVKAERREPMQWHRAMRELALHAPRAPGMPMDFAFPEPPDAPAIAAMVHPIGSRWGRVELAPLNAELGEYFGSDKGILVVSVPGDNPIGLKGGDVILSIGGREPESPSHAFRIVRSYTDGETLEIEILRHGKRQTLTHELTGEDMEGIGMAPLPGPPAVRPGPAPEMPIAAPAPAAPPAVDVARQGSI